MRFVKSELCSVQKDWFCYSGEGKQWKACHSELGSIQPSSAGDKMKVEAVRV